MEERVEFAWHAVKRQLDAAGQPYPVDIQYLVDHHFPAYDGDPLADEPVPEFRIVNGKSVEVN